MFKKTELASWTKSSLNWSKSCRDRIAITSAHIASRHNKTKSVTILKLLRCSVHLGTPLKSASRTVTSKAVKLHIGHAKSLRRIVSAERQWLQGLRKEIANIDFQIKSQSLQSSHRSAKPNTENILKLRGCRKLRPYKAESYSYDHLTKQADILLPLPFQVSCESSSSSHVPMCDSSSSSSRQACEACEFEQSRNQTRKPQARKTRPSIWPERNASAYCLWIQRASTFHMTLSNQLST